MREHLGDDLPGQDLDGAALLALGATGADVERIVRGARRRARNAGRSMEITDLLAEIGGADDRTPQEMARAAIHEAGHAVVALELGMPVGAATLRAGDGKVIGVGHDRYYPIERDIRDQLVGLLAGRAAEQVVMGEPSAASGGGESSDLAQATWLAARSLSEFGYDAERGLLWQPMPGRMADFRRVLAGDPALADLVRSMLAEVFSEACDIVTRRRTAVQSVATALLERTALDGGEVARIVEADGRGDLP
jgi:ATP-dependent Zn protease